jgi:hypothetical protein
MPGLCLDDLAIVSTHRTGRLCWTGRECGCVTVKNPHKKPEIILKIKDDGYTIIIISKDKNWRR